MSPEGMKKVDKNEQISMTISLNINTHRLTSSYQKKQKKDMNKSSSFYSQAYYQKARKEANIRKPIYRQKNKQLYDQQHELDLKYYYVNRTGTCQMILYHDFIIQCFYQLKDKDTKGEIKGSDDFNSAYADFQFKIREKMKFFNDQMMCNQYETREQVMKREEMAGFQAEQKEEQIIQFQNLVHNKQKQENFQIGYRRLSTCNECPILIEQFQLNFDKVIKQMRKTSIHWDKLNGHQKFSKLRSHFEQYFGVLKYEFTTKCKYANEIDTQLANQNRIHNNAKR